jgi:hypothetical protein
MKSRLIALCLFLVLVVALVPGVMAQDANLCGNLSGDDCTALTTAITNTGAATSGAFTLSSVIDVQSDDPTQAAHITIDGDGKFSGTSPVSMTDMTSASSDPTAAMQKATEALKSFSGEYNFTFGLPAEAAAMTGGQPLTLNVIFINGVVYVDLSKLPASIAPMLQQMKLANGWQGLDLIDTLTQGSSMFAGMASSAGASGSSTSSEASTAMADAPKLMAAASKHITFTRDGDTFTGSVDLNGLASDPDIQAMMMAANKDAKPMTDADKAAIDSLKDAKVDFVFVLNGDKLGEVKLTLDIPGTTLAALNAAGESSSTDSKPPTNVNVSFDLKYSGLGEAQTIAAPAGAPVLKFADLMTMFGSMSGGSSG